MNLKYVTSDLLRVTTLEHMLGYIVVKFHKNIKFVESIWSVRSSQKTYSETSD